MNNNKIEKKPKQILEQIKEENNNQVEIYIDSNIEIDNTTCYNRFMLNFYDLLPFDNDKLKTKWLKQFIIDVIIIIINGLLLHFLITKKYFLKQYRFCIPYLNTDCNLVTEKDPTIAYPYTELSIGAPESFFLSILPFIVLVPINFFIYFINGFPNYIKFNLLFIWFLNVLRAIATTSAYTTLIVHILKYIIGIPRPNAYSLIHLSENKEIGYSIDSAYESFPSGHIAIGYTNCYLFGLLCQKSLLYSIKKLKYNLKDDKNTNHFFFLPLFDVFKYFPTLSYTFIWFPLVGATYIGVSRIHEYWHSPLDCVTGALIGIFVAHNVFNRYYYEFYN
jgi:membrane-associated phospholipid phosphatase